MAGKFSFVTLYDGRHFTVERKKGDQMLRVLHGLEEPSSEAVGDKLLNVKSIYPSLSDPHRAAVTAEEAKSEYWDGLDKQKQEEASKSVALETKLTHPGILQGVSQQLPTGDRD